MRARAVVVGGGCFSGKNADPGRKVETVSRNPKTGK